MFAASNQRDAAKLLAIHGAVLSLAQRLHEAHGLAFEQIDLGGGLGIPYASEQAPLDLATLGRGHAELLARHPWFTGELILEPGRFLAGPCGMYLARVVRIKESRGTRFAILEGGINHLIRPLLTGEPFPVKAVGKGEGSVQYAGRAPLHQPGSPGGGAPAGAGRGRSAGLRQHRRLWPERRHDPLPEPSGTPEVWVG